MSAKGEQKKMQDNQASISQADFDVAVIGAGLSGIAFARFWLETHSDSRLVILESGRAVGGVWSSTRVFDAFWCQSPLRQTSFSDVPLQLPPDAPTNHDMFPAKYVSQYLEDYVKMHSYEGKSIRDRIWLNSKVQAIEKADDLWTLRVLSGSAMQSVRCNKLIVATGITSLPMLPTCFLNKGCPIEAIHHRDFGATESRIFAADSGYKNVTVVGGGKSAADMAYAAVKAGCKVSWLVRKTGGHGPGLFLPAAAEPYRHIAEATNTLTATVLNPSAFKPLGGYASHLNYSETSEAIIAKRIEAVDRRCKADANYRNRVGALPGFKDLEPRGSYFWTSAPTGIPQHSDFWDVISQNVQIFSADVSALVKGTIVLSDGRSIPTDIALCGTGWSIACPFLTPEQTQRFGLPHTLDPICTIEQQEWALLLEEADHRVLHDYPFLKRSSQVSQESMSRTLTPSRLYRGIAPLTDDTILFLGRTRVANSFRTSEAQAIWATAYLDGHIQMPSLEDRKRDVAYHSMFSRRRYPTSGGHGLNLYSDILWYTERLVSEAGLESHRKEWWYDWNTPTFASDFQDCKDEYLRKYGGGSIPKSKRQVCNGQLEAD